VPTRPSLNERLFPAKVGAAVVALLYAIGLFIVSLNRGISETYPVAAGLLVLLLAVGIIVAVWRRRSRTH
jgi:protein-S-isoprenylcysteine O-methyltransferase Ste14